MLTPGRWTSTLADPDDAGFIKVYSAIFPGLLKPMGEMPADPRGIDGYPVGFFAIQISLYATYHMEDPKVF